MQTKRRLKAPHTPSAESIGISFCMRLWILFSFVRERAGSGQFHFSEPTRHTCKNAGANAKRKTVCRLISGLCRREKEIGVLFHSWVCGNAPGPFSPMMCVCARGARRLINIMKCASEVCN